jgi:hypothetical protein
VAPDVLMNGTVRRQECSTGPRIQLCYILPSSLEPMALMGSPQSERCLSPRTGICPLVLDSLEFVLIVEFGSLCEEAKQDIRLYLYELVVPFCTACKTVFSISLRSASLRSRSGLQSAGNRDPGPALHAGIRLQWQPGRIYTASPLSGKPGCQFRELFRY